MFDEADEEWWSNHGHSNGVENDKTTEPSSEGEEESSSENESSSETRPSVDTPTTTVPETTTVPGPTSPTPSTPTILGIEDYSAIIGMTLMVFGAMLVLFTAVWIIRRKKSDK